MNRFVAFLLIMTVAIASCKKSDPPLPDNLVQFEAAEQGLESNKNDITIKIKLSRAAEVAIPVTINFTESGVAYGTHYTTAPAATVPAPANPAEKVAFTLTIPAGSMETAFTLTKAAGILLNGDEFIGFEVKTAGGSVLVGATSKLKLKFSSIVSTGSALELNGGTGGSGAINSVYVDFSNNAQTAVLRKSWDLGFHGGNPFRVIINNATAAAVIAVNKTDINQVTAADINTADLAIGLGAGTMSLIDDPEGDITKTAIPEISATDGDNKVYVISRAGATGSAPALTDLKKIRILRTATGYTLQYANIDATTFQTLTIDKNAAYNFRYISFETGAVEVEPAKDRWDIQWTWSIYKTDNPPGSGQFVPYAFSDLVFTNRPGGAQVAEVMTSTVSYNDFAESHIAGVSFSNKRDAVGSRWRATTGTIGVKTDRFYVVKDPVGNVYKLKFINFHSPAVDGGKRGYPNIEYKLVKKGV